VKFVVKFNAEQTARWCENPGRCGGNTPPFEQFGQKMHRPESRTVHPDL
jgi:hypothetical protein